MRKVKEHMKELLEKGHTTFEPEVREAGEAFAQEFIKDHPKDPLIFVYHGGKLTLYLRNAKWRLNNEGRNMYPQLKGERLTATQWAQLGYHIIEENFKYFEKC